MARKPRVHFPGALYHVILQGNDGQTIFFDDKDRTRFYFLLQEGVERFGHRIHAFCLMGNHVHIAIQVSEVSLSRILQNLSFRYTRWVNRRQGRSGHLFQGPKVSLVGFMKAVCRKYSIKEGELRGSGRGRRLSEVRGRAAWLKLELGGKHTWGIGAGDGP